jgi:MOSC domain-containing protein YiiM
MLTLTRGAGVAGDSHGARPWLKLPDGSPDPRLAVSLIPSRVLDLVWRERDRVAHPGDNIAVDMSLSETDLPAGTLLAAGTAVLRVSDMPNDGCAKWKVRCGRAAHDWITTPEALLLRLRGLYCAVERDGDVRLGDVLRRL